MIWLDFRGWALAAGEGGVQFLRRGSQFHRLRFHRLGRGAAAGAGSDEMRRLVVTVGEGVQRVADKGVQRGRFGLGGDVLEGQLIDVAGIQFIECERNCLAVLAHLQGRDADGFFTT